MSNGDTAGTQPKRIVSVDQLRGYAIFGMLLVNASGLFFDPVTSTLESPGAQKFWDACLFQLSHHKTTFTYADTIAPLFVFVVGMGMRLSWLRRSESTGLWQGRKSLMKRYAIMVLIAFALYAGWLWDALMDIGLAGLLAVAFIDKKPRTRLIAAFALVALYQSIYTFTSYGTWVAHGKFSLDDADYVPFLVRLIPLNGELFGTSLNGGPLGPLSWVMMLLFGSYAYDLMSERNEKKLVLGCLTWGVALCAAGYALHVEWPGLKTEWPFSARYMNAPFPLWATGLCFLQLLAFYLICDKLNLRIPTFTSVGMNPLILYIAQSLFLDVAEGFAPEQWSLLAGIAGFAVFWGVIAGSAYFMHQRKIYIKI
ncbi:MAG: membrane protein [Candidatus Hydrogenedentota bacterium]